MVLCCRKKQGDEDSDDDEQPLGCTDTLALVIFIFFWCGMVVLAVFAATLGDPWRLIYGVDSFGNVCGRKNMKIYPGSNLSGLDLHNKTYLFPMDFENPFDSLWICIEKCPNALLENRSDLIEFTSAHLCSYDVQKNDYAEYHLYPSSNLGPCPKLPLVPSQQYMKRCVPMLLPNSSIAEQETATQVLDYADQKDALQRLASDFLISFKGIIVLGFVSLAISLMVGIVILLFSSIVAYLMFILAVFGSLALTISLWCAYADGWSKLYDLQVSFNTSRPVTFFTDTCNQKAILIYAIISTMFTLVLSLATCLTWRNISLVAELFQQVGRCILKIPSMLFLPVITFVLLSVFFAVWTAFGLMLATADYASATNHTAAPYGFQLVFLQYNVPGIVKMFWWYYLIGLIWTSEFLLGCQQLVTGASVASWYFAKKTDPLGYPVCRSIARLIGYHLGSVALGTFLITLVQIPRSILMPVLRKMEKDKSICAKNCLKTCVCCKWCNDSCLRYVHHNAYTIIAVEGMNFCESAKFAYEISNQNTGGSSVVNTVGNAVLFLGKCGVTCIVAFIAVLVFKNNSELHFYAGPLLFVCLVSYLVNHCVFTVYEMVIDTLFLCHCEKERLKCEAQTGYMPEELYVDSALNSFMNRLYGPRTRSPETQDTRADEYVLHSLNTPKRT